MKHYSSWTVDEKRKFLADWAAAKPHSAERKALLKKASVHTKQISNVKKHMEAAIAKAGKQGEEQTALALPNGEPLPSEEGNPAKRKVFSDSARKAIVEKYFTAPKPDRQRLLKEHGITAALVHSWTTGTKWAHRPGAQMKEDTISKRLASRKMSLDEKIRLGREYAAAGRGNRAAIAERTGITLGALLKWAKLAEEHDARNGRATNGTSLRMGAGMAQRMAQTLGLSEDEKRQHGETFAQLRHGQRGPYAERVGIARDTLLRWARQYGGDSARARSRHDDDGEERPVEEARPESGKKLSYNDLLKQNLILKGLLDIAKQQGFDMETILRFGK